MMKKLGKYMQKKIWKTKRRKKKMLSGKKTNTNRLKFLSLHLGYRLNEDNSDIKHTPK